MSYQFLQYMPPRSSYTPSTALSLRAKPARRDRDRPSLGLKPKRKSSALTLTATDSADDSVGVTTSVCISVTSSIPACSGSSNYKSDQPPTITGSTNRPRPIPNSYWATPLLLACEYPFTPQNPHKPKLDTLLRAGVRTFIDLTEDGELVPYSALLGQRCKLLGIDEADVEYHRFAIRDRCLPESVELMYEILDTLRSNADRTRIAAVHCRGGIGRTGMVIGCWLVEGGVAKNGAEALEVIAREWKGVEKCVRYPNSPETGAQFDFVFKFCPKAVAAKGARFMQKDRCFVGGQ